MKRKIYLSILLAGFLNFLMFNLGAQPDWDVNPNQFVYSMTITGKITTDNHFSEDENDMVAAFIDGECRGIANVKYQKTIDGYFVFLMIYGNEATGTVTFKVYDASKDKVIDAKETINFTVNDIVGSVNNPFVIKTSSIQDDAKLLSFNIPNQEGKTLITGNNVYLKIKWNEDLLDIIPEFNLSPGAKAYVDDIEQISGVTVNDFVRPVEYVIESSDKSSSTVYKVFIKVANDIPTDITLSNNQIEENSDSSLIGLLTTITENPEEEHVYSFVNTIGSENGYFFISGNKLHAKTKFNKEQQESYKITIRADDQRGGRVEKNFTVEILDVNESPTDIVLINTNIQGNLPVNSTIGELSAIDEDVGDTHTFSLVEGDGLNDQDNGSFYIEGNKLKNSVELSFNEETLHRVLIEAEDSEGSVVVVPLEITKQSTGTAPQNIILSNSVLIDIEDSSAVFVGTLIAEDPDQQSGHVFSLVDDGDNSTDNNYFSIHQDSLFLDNPQPVAEKSVYTIYLQVSDSMENLFSKAFQVKVEEKLEDNFFFLTNYNLPENQPFNTIVGYFDSKIYQSSDYSFKLPLEVDLSTYCNNDFKLNGRTLLTNQVFDFEQEQSVMIQIEVSDGTTNIKQDLQVNIINKNDPPTKISLSTQIVSESTKLNTAVAKLIAEDQDEGDAHEFSFIVGNGINDESNSMFRITNDQLILAGPLNYEEKEYHNILLRVTDSGGATFDQNLRLKVADANDAPEFISAPLNYILQNEVYVYPIIVEDSEGDEVELSFDNLPEWLSFNTTTNLLTGMPGNEWVGDYSFTIVATDGNKESEQEVLLSVINVNDPPEINNYIEEQMFFTNQKNQIKLPSDCIIDPDQGDELSFSLSTENNSALPSWLSFDAETLTLSGNPPYEAYGIHNLKLTATDGSGKKEWMVFILNVTYLTPVSDLNDVQEFKIYPNPVSDYLHLQIPQGSEDAKITITNSSGIQIKKFHLAAGSRKTISFTMAAGVYFVKYAHGKNQKIQKVIKY